MKSTQVKSVQKGHPCSVALGVLVLLAAATGCAVTSTTLTATEVVDATAQSSTSTSTTTSTSSTESATGETSAPPPLPLGFRRCAALLSTGEVMGPLSEDPEIARAQQWRADNGLQSDEEWVRSVPLQDRTSAYAGAFDAPLTDDEVEELFSRGADLDAGALDAYLAEHQATFGGYWLDNTTRSPTISFTQDVDARRNEVSQLTPGVRVVEANLTEAELAALQTELMQALSASGLAVSSGVLIQAGGGVVSIGVPVLDEPTIALVAEAADPALTCLEGQELDRYTPPGPQAQAGEGWRLLGLGEVDLPLQVVFDTAGFEQLWAEFAPSEDVPVVDFDAEIVVVVPTRGAGVSNGPCGTRFDGWQVVDGVVQLDLPSPGGQSVCDAVAIPGAYVIALDAADIATEAASPVVIEVVAKEFDGPIASGTFDR